MKGHWFCSSCNDVKFFPAPFELRENAVERCPDCRNNSMAWVPDAPERTAPGMEKKLPVYWCNCCSLAPVKSQGEFCDYCKARSVTKEEGAKRFAEIRQAINAGQLENPS